VGVGDVSAFAILKAQILKNDGAVEVDFRRRGKRNAMFRLVRFILASVEIDLYQLL
jgi:hypothetical protein